MEHPAARGTAVSVTVSAAVVNIQGGPGTTIYPERLLTGERPEPTFLITKPFQPATGKAVISQALFFERKAHIAPKRAAG